MMECIAKLIESGDTENGGKLKNALIAVCSGTVEALGTARYSV